MPYNTVVKAKSRARATLAPETAPAKYDASLEDGAAWAKTWIDGRLGSKFEDRVPFTDPVPELIQEISADLAAHFTLKQAFAGGGESKTPTLAQDLFDRAELALDRLLDGTMALPKPVDETATGPSLGIYSNQATQGAKLPIFYDRHLSQIDARGNVLPPGFSR